MKRVREEQGREGKRGEMREGGDSLSVLVGSPEDQPPHGFLRSG